MLYYFLLTYLNFTNNHYYIIVIIKNDYNLYNFVIYIVTEDKSIIIPKHEKFRQCINRNV